MAQDGDLAPDCWAVQSLAGMLASPSYYGPGPYYYGPGPPYFNPRRLGYVATPPGNAVVYCMQRFKSYDPRSGTYLGYDGLRRPAAVS